MNREQNSLNEKRQKALQRLRDRYGNDRATGENQRKLKTDTAKLLLQSYRTQKSLNQESETMTVTEPLASPEQLPKVAKAAQQVEEQEKRKLEATQRLKETLQARRARQSQEKTEAKVNSSVGPEERQQLMSDILSTEFLGNVYQWISSAKDDPELSSTPLENIEALYKQTQYRYKVLKVMLEETQRELDAIQVHLKAMRNSSQP